MLYSNTISFRILNNCELKIQVLRFGFGQLRSKISKYTQMKLDLITRINY